MYEIAEVSSRHVTTSRVHHSMGSSTTAVNLMVLVKPFKKSYKKYSNAVKALDKITQKGIFTIIKINE